MEEFLPWMLLVLADPGAASTAPPVTRVPGLFVSHEACEAAAAQRKAAPHACLQVPPGAEMEAAWQAFRAGQENSR